MKGHVSLSIHGRTKPDRVSCVATGHEGEAAATLEITVQPEFQDISMALLPSEARHLARQLLAAASLVEALR